MPSAAPSGGFPPAHRGNLLLCSEKRNEEKSPTTSKAPEFSLTAILSLFFNTPLRLLFPPPSFAPSASLHLALFRSSYERQRFRARIGSQIAKSQRRGFDWISVFPQVRTGQPLFIHPGNLRRSGLCLHLLASLPATSVLLHVADRRCTSGASPFCLFLFLFEPRRSPLVLATRPVGKAARLPAGVVHSCYSR